MATVAACTFAAANSSVRIPKPFVSEKEFAQALVISRRRLSATAASGVYASMSVAATPLSTKPDDLVESILSQVGKGGGREEKLEPRATKYLLLPYFSCKNTFVFAVCSIIIVVQTDRGVLLSRNEHQRVAEVANALQKFCVAEPTKCPLIFGEWDVQYCSNPTSPGGGYRNAFGRLIFKTKEMIQVIESPDTVKNRVSFSLMGLLDGEVSLKGKLTALDGEWIRVVFEPPELKVGGWEFKYGGESEVKLQITYIDDKVRLGKGSRGSLFVFQRHEPLP